MEFISLHDLYTNSAIMSVQIHRLRKLAWEQPITMRYNIYLQIVDLEKELLRYNALIDLRILFDKPITYVHTIAIKKSYIVETH